jgi:hypothetical protein
VPGDAHEEPEPGRQDAEERAATRRPFCARTAGSVNRDGTRRLAARVPRRNARSRVGRLNPHAIRENGRRGRLTPALRRVYARCTSGGAKRVLLREKAVAAVVLSVTGQPRRAT